MYEQGGASLDDRAGGDDEATQSLRTQSVTTRQQVQAAHQLQAVLRAASVVNTTLEASHRVLVSIDYQAKKLRRAVGIIFCGWASA